MAERKRAKTTSSSSPLATVEEIQRRLVRPSSTSISPPPTSTFSSTSSQFKLRTTKKLEDYLEAALLAEVASNLSRAKKVAEAKSRKKAVEDFEWPIDELKALVDSDKEAVNLGDGLDQIEEFGYGDVDACAPFRRFEQIASWRFKR